MLPHSIHHRTGRRELRSAVTLQGNYIMGFVIPMLLAFMLAVAAMSVLGTFALRESQLMKIFHEDTEEYPRG